MEKTAVKKVIDLKDKLEAYRASALAAGSGRGRGSERARLGNLAMASAAAGGAALAVIPSAEAVIVHFVPDSPIVLAGYGSDTYSIDMDGDGKYDFVISHYLSTSTDSTIDGEDTITYSFNTALISLATSGSSILATNGTRYAKALSGNYNIAYTLTGNGTTGTWTNTQSIKLGSDSDGPFQGKGRRYIGVRFENDSGQHYGWIQVILAQDSTSLTIVDWAYEDGTIPAGAVEPPMIVPSLNEWGLIVLITLLAGAAAWKMKRSEPLQA